MNQIQLELVTTGFTVEFRPVSCMARDGWIDFETILRVTGQSPILGVSSFLSVSDLLRLADHLMKFVNDLRHDSESSTYAFVPINLGFEIEPIDGESFEGGDGEILLRAMLNVGADESGTRIYAGAMGPISFRQVNQFKASVHTFSQELERRGGGGAPR